MLQAHFIRLKDPVSYLPLVLTQLHMDTTELSLTVPPPDKSSLRPYKCPFPLCGRSFARLEHQVSEPFFYSVGGFTYALHLL